jgi:hypothetical protein
MSIAGLAASALFSAIGSSYGSQSSQSQKGFQQIQSDFQQLGQDLQSGNLSQAQQDFTTLQQDLQQNAGTTQVHHHHHHAGRGGNSQAQSQINQAFSSLASDLQSSNLSAAQSDFATLQQDLENLNPSGLQSYTTAGAANSGQTTGSNISVSA